MTAAHLDHLRKPRRRAHARRGRPGLRAVIWPGRPPRRVGLAGATLTPGARSGARRRPPISSTSTSPAPARRSTLPLDLHGTPSSSPPGSALAEIPYGETRTYAEQAARARPAGGGAGGRRGERPQPALDRAPLPPRGRQQRRAPRVRRRARGQGGAARARAGTRGWQNPGARLKPRSAPAPATLSGPGRARWGGSGSLNPKSAPAGPNAVRGTASSGLGLRTRC